MSEVIRLMKESLGWRLNTELGVFMHNCKSTRERVTELLLNSVDVRPTELLECSECSDEFDSIKETLRITKRQLEATVPSESYWNQYHEKLQRRLNVLVDHEDQVVTPAATARASWLSRMFTSSIRVPMPVAAAVLLVVGLCWRYEWARVMSVFWGKI